MLAISQRGSNELLLTVKKKKYVVCGSLKWGYYFLTTSCKTVTFSEFTKQTVMHVMNRRRWQLTNFAVFAKPAEFTVTTTVL